MNYPAAEQRGINKCVVRRKRRGIKPREIKVNNSRAFIIPGQIQHHNLSTVALGAGIDEGLGDHLDETAFIDADFLAADTEKFMAVGGKIAEELIDPPLMATQHLTRSNLIVAPEFAPAGTTSDDQQVITA